MQTYKKAGVDAYIDPKAGENLTFRAVDFTITLPPLISKGYKLYSYSTIGGDLAQITYKDRPVALPHVSSKQGAGY